MDFGEMFNTGTWIPILVSAPFVIIALIFAFFWVRARVKAGNARRTWQSTTGRIIASSVEIRHGTSSEGGRTTSHYPVIAYEYQVNGQRIYGQRLAFGGEVGYGSRTTAENIVAKYVPGSNVPVYYNPENPNDAVLEMRAGMASNIMGCVALFIVAILAFTLIMTTGAFGITERIVDMFTQFAR